MLRHIEHTGRDGGLVAHAKEARHVWLYHHIFLGNGLAVQESVHHVLRMGNAQEAPGGEALRQGEPDTDKPCAVGQQLRIEESRFLQVLAHLHFRLRRFFLRNIQACDTALQRFTCLFVFILWNPDCIIDVINGNRFLCIY